MHGNLHCVPIAFFYYFFPYCTTLFHRRYCISDLVKGLKVMAAFQPPDWSYWNSQYKDLKFLRCKGLTFECTHSSKTQGFPSSHFLRTSHKQNGNTQMCNHSTTPNSQWCTYKPPCDVSRTVCAVIESRSYRESEENNGKIQGDEEELEDRLVPRLSSAASYDGVLSCKHGEATASSASLRLCIQVLITFTKVLTGEKWEPCI